MTQLSAQQQAGMEKIKSWFGNAEDTIAFRDTPPPFRFFGPAGTGKTTVAKLVPEVLGLRSDEVAYGTYTGKAAHVLRSKGAGPVSTIHSAIYSPMEDYRAKRALAEAREELEDLRDGLEEIGYQRSGSLGSNPGFSLDDPERMTARIAALEAQIPDLEKAARKIHWDFNPEGPWSTLRLIILDEVSMVDAKMAEEIQSYGVPVLVLGDPAQLPPVRGEGYYINGTPDVLLTEVHRTALDNPITALATRIRTDASGGSYAGLGREHFRPASVREAADADQVICWSNRMRWSLIEAIRSLKGFAPKEPVPGDRIMCLTNNRDLSVFNGQQFEVVSTMRDAVGYTLQVNADDQGFLEIPVFADGFLGREMQDQAKNSNLGQKGNRMLATFSQAITCHKAQGSEWRNVYVVNELAKMYGMETRNRPGEWGQRIAAEKCRQWLYTAATRAQEGLIITAPRGQ